MGWVVVVVARPLIEGLPGAFTGVAPVAGGRVTIGALVYLLDDKVRYAHFVWHLFVVSGSACHVFAVLSQTA
ncbi:MAG: hypothetical protein R3E68_18345 [Burkholderiaceae bacterium]